MALWLQYIVAECSVCTVQARNDAQAGEGAIGCSFSAQGDSLWLPLSM